MIYIQKIGLNRIQAKDVSSDNAQTPDKMQQRRQAFNEMNYEIYQKLNQTQTTMSSTKKSYSFNATNRLNSTFYSHTESKLHSPRRMSLHRSSLNPLQMSRQANDQFSVRKTSKCGGTMRLSQMNFCSSKGNKDVMHIDEILESYRKSHTTKYNLQKIEKQEKLQQLSSNEINFVNPEREDIIKMRKKINNLRRSSQQTNNTSLMENTSIKNSSQCNMNTFLNDIDLNTAFNSQSKTQNLDEFSLQQSKKSNIERKENSISGYAIFKSTDTPMNISTSKTDDDMISRQSFTLSSNHFRVQKRNNPYKRFYKGQSKKTENNLYRYIDTQSENSPSKLSQGTFQRILEKTDTQLQSKTSEEINISQYYNPAKNNMSNLMDGEGKVYKKYYELSLQSRIEYLKKLKIQNEAQMMLINYNFINEMESTNKLIYKAMPKQLASKFSNLIDPVKQNIYSNAQIQKQQQYQYEKEQQQKLSQYQNQHNNSYLQEEEHNEEGEDNHLIYNHVPNHYN